jgi:hypothetical protein
LYHHQLLKVVLIVTEEGFVIFVQLIWVEHLLPLSATFLEDQVNLKLVVISDLILIMGASLLPRFVQVRKTSFDLFSMAVGRT